MVWGTALPSLATGGGAVLFMAVSAPSRVRLQLLKSLAFTSNQPPQCLRFPQTSDPVI